jgi:hypothetical protein
MKAYTGNLSYMKLSLAGAAVAIGCLFAGCSRAPDSYYPLAAGKYWRYGMTYHTMDGNFKGIYAVENLGRKKENDHEIHVRRLLDGSSDFLRIDDQGIHLTGREKTDGERVDLDHQIFQFPLVVGKEWQDTTISRALIKTGPPQKTEFHISAEVPVTARIESMTDVVSIPAGTFVACMRISLKGNAFTDAGNYVGLTIVNIEETDWYAPGVGLVKSIRKESTPSKALDRGEIILELESYRR